MPIRFRPSPSPHHAFQPSELAPFQRAKNRVVPTGPRMRRLPLGIGRGLRLELDLQHWARLYLGLYEVELNRHLRALCRPGYRSFDVGGQNGYDAMVIARLTGAQVLSFECESELADAMRRSVVANPDLKDLVHVHDGYVTHRSYKTESLIALDDVAFGEDGFMPDFIKMDIEGAELEALKGAQHILCRRHPNMLIEVHSWDLEMECGKLLADVGYTPSVVNPRKWVPDNRPTEHNRWLIAKGA